MAAASVALIGECWRRFDVARFDKFVLVTPAVVVMPGVEADVPAVVVAAAAVVAGVVVRGVNLLAACCGCVGVDGVRRFCSSSSICCLSVSAGDAVAVRGGGVATTGAAGVAATFVAGGAVVATGVFGRVFTAGWVTCETPCDAPLAAGAIPSGRGTGAAGVVGACAAVFTCAGLLFMAGAATLGARAGRIICCPALAAGMPVLFTAGLIGAAPTMPPLYLCCCTTGVTLPTLPV